MVGCVIVYNSTIIGEGFTSPYGGAHAEVNAINSVNDTSLLKEATLYVTLEPCIMCVGAIMHARVKRLVFAASDPRAGAIHSAYTIPDDGKLNHSLEVESGVLAEECSSLLTNFFRARRK